MIENPLVSVCIQTYQHAPFIRQCLDSVLSQKANFPFEIIIGEDDSTDGTREICKEYAAKFPDIIRLFLRSEKDKIYIDGKKTGRFNFLSNLSEARGKYIALLDGDDYWCDELKLQKQVDWMESNSRIVLCSHPVYQLDENAGLYIPEKFNSYTSDRIHTLDDLLKTYFLNMSSIVFQRKCIEDMPAWFTELVFMDYPLSIHIAQKGDIGMMQYPMSVYRQHKGGIWSAASAYAKELKLWKFYTILSNRFNGKIQDAMRVWRKGRGHWLVHFYRAHLWYRSSWLKKDLQQDQFPEDKGLLAYLEEPIHWNDVKANLLNILRVLKIKK